ncbi:unnamed protein product [Symbiodinium natans]|uniref:Uncharacterized protein n=1 Tax=Symbiodinium natans TaxID=878477 RepID=A0A812TIB4_9DINO|nr:unnamed protein product [Symbiodinium natans]
MPAVQCFRRLCSRGGKIAPADLDSLDAIGPRPPPSGEASIVVLFDVAEIQMAQYLLDHSAAEPGRRTRILRSLKVLLIIPLVACFNYWPFVIPFADPAGGMWANWTYLIAHIFALNYIAGRCMLAVWTRAFRPEDLAEVWCVMWSAPLVTPCVCGLIHVVASFAGVFPVPLSAAAACLPAVLVTQRVAQYFMPAHVVTATVRQFGWFLFVVIGAWRCG